MFFLEFINYIYSLINYIFFFKIIIGLYILQVLVCKQKEEKEIDHEDDNGPIYYDNEDHLNEIQLKIKKEIDHDEGKLNKIQISKNNMTLINI
jgi:hypothetical protein